MSFLSKFILRNLKKNRGIYLMYVKFNFVNIPNTLTMISSCINKQRKTSFKQSLTRKIHLLRSLSSNPSEMPSYNHYVQLGFPSYKMSPLDSSRYIEYIRKNCLGCNVLGVSSKHFLAILAQHLRIEAELEKAKERIVRLRK